MVFNKYFPFVNIRVTDDNGTVRNNLAGSTPFPLEVERMSIRRTAGTEAGTIELQLPNRPGSGTYGVVGAYNSYFTQLGNYCEVYIGAGSPGDKLFSGNIKAYTKALKNTINILNLKGEDLTKQLINRLIGNAVIYLESENRDYAYVIRDLVNNKSNTDVVAPTGTVPDTGINIDTNKTFYRMPLWDAVKGLADEVKMDVWVDAAGSLRLNKKGSVTNSFVIDSGSIVSEVTSTRDIDRTKNIIWIYAGKIQGELLTNSLERHQYSTSQLAYNLGHNLVGSITVVAGSIGGTPFTFTSPRDYVLQGDYALVWQTAGSRPENGSNFGVTYLYNTHGRHVVAYAADNAIIDQYSSPRTEWIRRLDIAANASGATVNDRYTDAKDQAKAYAQGQLQIKKIPRDVISVKLNEFQKFDVSEQVLVNLPEFSIINTYFKVKELEYIYSRKAPMQTNLTLEEILPIEL